MDGRADCSSKLNGILYVGATGNVKATAEADAWLGTSGNVVPERSGEKPGRMINVQRKLPCSFAY